MVPKTALWVASGERGCQAYAQVQVVQLLYVPNSCVDPLLYFLLRYQQVLVMPYVTDC